jgi:hypothetical protein
MLHEHDNAKSEYIGTVRTGECTAARGKIEENAAAYRQASAHLTEALRLLVPLCERDALRLRVLETDVIDIDHARCAILRQAGFLEDLAEDQDAIAEHLPSFRNPPPGDEENELMLSRIDLC